MEQFKQEAGSQIKVETIKTPDGNEVSFCPERGGIITSIKLQGKELLYLDESTLKNPEVNVKGGIPILFPNAGPIPEEIKTKELENLKQHGFARESKWNISKEPDGFTETLDSNSKTKESYPYDFKMSVKFSFGSKNSFKIDQLVENNEKEKDMPISGGYHPYFNVPSSEKSNIKFNFEDGKKVEEQVNIWANGKAISIKNPNEPIEVVIPNLGTLIFDISKEYERIWIWSMEGKDFVCIEPVMRDKGGIILNPEKIKPGEKHESSFSVTMKE